MNYECTNSYILMHAKIVGVKSQRRIKWADHIARVGRMKMNKEL